MKEVWLLTLHYEDIDFGILEEYEVHVSYDSIAAKLCVLQETQEHSHKRLVFYSYIRKPVLSTLTD